VADTAAAAAAAAGLIASRSGDPRLLARSLGGDDDE